MRLTEFVIVIVAALLFLIPTMKKEETSFEREMQEETPVEEVLMEDESEINTFRISYEAKSPSEDSVADILWMKKAAETARGAGIPYFNVLKQKIKKRYVPKFKMELSVVEGMIQLENDPMEAEYDANEIESLVLTDP